MADRDTQELWNRFRRAVATTDHYLVSHDGCVRAPRTDLRRIGYERCIEATRAAGHVWKSAFLSGSG
ncbi:MAG TPA: hypothetical protein VK943_20005 [Arenibaculum sp.]|nr:hypothetical protein [Arenibaculum sp.]